MKNKAKALFLAGVLAATSLLTACGGSSTTTPSSSAVPESTPPQSSTVAEAGAQFEDVTIRVGATVDPHAILLEQIQDDLAAIGITLIITEFDDYVLPNLAVDSGDLDANFFQHLPYLEDFNANNDTDLVSIGEIHLEPMAVYPGKTDSIEALEDGAKIGIPADPTNGGRALSLLASLGLIKLDATSGYEPTKLDITENPLNLEFVEVSAEQLPNTLADVDLGVINGNYALVAGIQDTALATEGKDTFYGNIIAVRAGDETRPELLALLEALQSDKIRAYIADNYGDQVVPLF